MRRLSAVAVLVALAGASACSSDDASSAEARGAAGPKLELVEFPFNAPLGPLRTEAWASKPLGSHMACGVFLADGKRVSMNLDTGLTLELFDRSSDVAVWSADLRVLADHRFVCQKMFVAPDGDLVVVGRRVSTVNNFETLFQIIRVAPDGKWRSTSDLRGDLTNVETAALLTSGNLALSFALEPAPGSLEGPDDLPTVGVVTPAGAFASTTRLPYEVIKAQDHPGNGAVPTRTPGTGVPTVRAIAPTPDGGFVAAGEYHFYRYIECGTQSHPEDPVGTACGNSNTNGFVGRFDASAKPLWLARIGVGYDSPALNLTSVALLSDGSVLATGTVLAEVGVVYNPHVLAAAVRYGGDGKPLWAKGFAWGKLPGGAFFEGRTLFDALTPMPGGAADMMMHVPKGSSCRVVRIEPNGSISRVQPLDSRGQADCTAESAGTDLVYRYPAEEPLVVKLVP